MTILLQLIKNPKVILGIAFFTLLSLVVYQVDRIKTLKQEQGRLISNQENLLSENSRELILTKGELKRAVNDKTELGLKVDSLIKVSKTKLRTVKEVTIVETFFHDTVYVQAKNGQVTVKDGRYSIPVSQDTDCWGMKGEILSKDSTSVLFISDKTFLNEIDLIKGKKGILWWKKEFFKARTKCGDINFTKIIVQ